MSSSQGAAGNSQAKTPEIPLMEENSSTDENSSPTRFLSIVGAASLGILVTGAALGFRHGSKEARKLEVLAKENPAIMKNAKTAILPPISPEARRAAVIRAFSAFGLGTALCLSTAAVVTFSIAHRWEVSSFKEFHEKIQENTRNHFISPLNHYFSSVPQYMEKKQLSFRNSSLGQWVHKKSSINEEKGENSSLNEQEENEIVEQFLAPVTGTSANGGKNEKNCVGSSEAVGPAEASANGQWFKEQENFNEKSKKKS